MGSRSLYHFALVLIFLISDRVFCSDSDFDGNINPYETTKISVRLTTDSAGRPRYVLSDPSGREVVFRGTNVEVEQRELDPYIRSVDSSDYLGVCPDNNPNYSQPPVCQVDAGKGMFQANDDYAHNNDMAQIRRLGFNMIRLCLSWSQLEPTPGVYSVEYLDRVSQLVRWAGEQGIYVLIDMHEDLYSRYIFGDTQHQAPPFLTAADGQDGAPSWAVASDGWPALSVLGISNLNLAMMKAFDNFYSNAVLNVSQGASPGPGLQDHYIGAIAALARRLEIDDAPVSSAGGNANDAVNANVLGYELMNEPQPGTHLLADTFAEKYLYPFYTRCIQALTGVRDGLPSCPVSSPFSADLSCAYPDLGIQSDRLMFYEPSALRNLLDFSPQKSKPFSEYKNLVFAPHVYTHEFTLDQSILKLNKTTSPYPPSFDFAYLTATSEAVTMKSAVFVTEFGCGTADDDFVLKNTLISQEKYLVSGAQWSWKSNCGGQPCDWSWTVMRPAVFENGTYLPNSGDVYPARLSLLSRVYPRVVAGSLYHQSYDPASHTFTMTANYSMTNGNVNQSTTIVFIPGSLSSVLSSPLVTVSGSASLLDITIYPDGSQSIPVLATGAGTGLYTITVVPSAALSPSQLTAKVEAEGRVTVQSRNEAMSNAEQDPTVLTNEKMLNVIVELMQQAVEIGSRYNLI